MPKAIPAFALSSAGKVERAASRKGSARSALESAAQHHQVVGNQRDRQPQLFEAVGAGHDGGVAAVAYPGTLPLARGWSPEGLVTLIAASQTG